MFTTLYYSLVILTDAHKKDPAYQQKVDTMYFFTGKSQHLNYYNRQTHTHTAHVRMHIHTHTHTRTNTIHTHTHTRTNTIHTHTYTH